MARLETVYKETILPSLVKQFAYKSIMQAPRITKITLNMGVGGAVADKKVLQSALSDMEKISGQKPVITLARKSIAGFKIRDDMPIGCKVTLRSDRMYEFLAAEGLGTDYWSLRLPEETQEYVPRFLALSTIFANPAAHGLKLAPVRNEPYFVKVKIDRKHDIEYLADKDFKEIAQLANLSYEQFSRLNPGYLNPKLATDGPFTFLMPAANANQLHQRLASIAQFLNDSTVITASHAPLKRRDLYPVDEQKTTLSSLLTDITLPKGADLGKVSNPFLSLNLDTNQTTPRIVNQSVMPSADSNSDPKQVKKNI